MEGNKSPVTFKESLKGQHLHYPNLSVNLPIHSHLWNKVLRYFNSLISDLEMPFFIPAASHCCKLFQALEVGDQPNLEILSIKIMNRISDKVKGLGRVQPLWETRLTYCQQCEPNSHFYNKGIGCPLVTQNASSTLYSWSALHTNIQIYTVQEKIKS